MMKRSLASFLGLLVVAFIALAQTPSAPANLVIMASQGGGSSGGEEEPEADPCENAIWIAQTAAGAQDGSSENDPRAISYLTSSANWGGGGSEIDPGDTVCLTGTITSTITFPGSGSSGNPVTIDGTNATLNPSSGDNLDATDRSWLVIQNMTYVDSETRTLFVADNSANIVLDNLHADDYRGAPAIFISQCDGGRSDNITIKNSFVRQAAEDFGNTQHDILQSEGATDLAIIGNHFVVRADGAGSNAHNDVIQTYESGCTVTGGHQPNENITIAYNWIEMDSNETNDRSWFMCEGLGGTNDIYRNVFVGIDGAEGANGISCQLNESGVVFNWFYNTLVAKSGASNNMLSLSGGTHNIRGNIVCAASSQTVLTGSGGTKNRSYNRWSGTNAPSAGGGSNDITNTGTSCANVGFTDYANNDFSLASGADSVDSGTDLGAPYNVAIDPSATWPDPATKALSGTADRGAYER